jgi:hypothetical protein
MYASMDGCVFGWVMGAKPTAADVLNTHASIGMPMGFDVHKGMPTQMATVAHAAGTRAEAVLLCMYTYIISPPIA